MYLLPPPLAPRYVHVDRGHGGFGFTLSGNAPVFIRSVDARGPAAKAGLQPGDQIMELNGLNVRSVSLSSVYAAVCVLLQSIELSKFDQLLSGMQPTLMLSGC